MVKLKYPEIGFRLPRSRFINGSITKKKTTDHKQQPLPAEKHHFWMAFAVPKNGPGVAEAVNGIIGHAWQTYTQVAGSAPVFEQMKLGLAATAFSWKIEDGDTHPSWSKRDYCRGHYVFMPKTYFDSITLHDGNNIMIDPALLLHGDYVDLYVTSSINGEVGGTAGIHLNPTVIRWLETGPRIAVGGANVDALMGGPTGQGYTQPQAGAMPAHLMAPSVPGQAGPAPLVTPVGAGAPPPPPASPPPPPAETDEAWNLRHTGHVAPGYRWNVQTGAWGPATPTPPAGNAPASVQGAPVYGQGQYVAGSGGVGTQAANPYSPSNPPPGVTPNHAFAGGPPRV